MKKYDKIGISLAYLGNFIITHWFIWSYKNFRIPGIEITTYLTTLGGLI